MKCYQLEDLDIWLDPDKLLYTWQNYLLQNHCPKLEDPFPTTLELFHINQKLINKLRNNNLLNPKIGQKFGLQNRESLLKNDLTPWEKTPKELDDCLPLNKFHIDTKKNLQKLRSNEEVIYNKYTILKFKIDEAPKIIGPRKETSEEAGEWRVYDE